MQESLKNRTIQEKSTRQLSILPSFSILNTKKTKGIRFNEHPNKRWGHSVAMHDSKMIIFGGRYNQRSLANIYSLDISSLTWSKIEPYGQNPPARDSHSVLIYKNDMIIFGGSGSGKKLNDLWSFNFNQKKWSKIFSTGNIPSPVEGHCVALIRNCYMMVYGGLDEDDIDSNEIYLLDLRNNFWILAKSKGQEPQLRDSQSCTMINNTCYIFGGQGDNDQRYNDMYQLNFEINETDKEFNAVWSIEETAGQKPPIRTSHSSVSYKNRLVFIIGGEGENDIPLNDIWVYDTINKEYTELDIKIEVAFEGRLCHSSILVDENIIIYGGMKNVEQTLDDLILICFEGNKRNESDAIVINQNQSLPNNNNNNIITNGKMGNVVEGQNQIQEDINNNNYISESFTTDPLLVKAINVNKIIRKDKISDTIDLNEENAFVFNFLKQKSIKKLISWSFLKEMSDIYQWPLGCIGNLIQNTLKEIVQTRKVYIDIKAYQSKCYSNDYLNGINEQHDNKSFLVNNIDIVNKKLVLSIIDDGIGINHYDFMQIMSSFHQNNTNRYDLLNKGMTMKLSALRLANGVLIISKHKQEISIGLISKNMQRALDLEFLIIPIVQWVINDSDNMNLSSSNIFWFQTLTLILQEVFFLFRNKESLFKYFNSFTQGTHIFLYDLKQRLSNEKHLNQLYNYELLFDNDLKDIYYNNALLTQRANLEASDLIDTSVRKYLSYLFIKSSSEAKVFIMDKEIELCNSYHNLKQITKQKNRNDNQCLRIDKLSTSNTEKGYDCISIDSIEYNGFLFNEGYIKRIEEQLIDLDTSLDNYNNNGILLYVDNILISRFNQSKFGDCSYYKSNKSQSNKINGYIELPLNSYSLLSSKLEFQDKAFYSRLYSRILSLISKLAT